MPKRIQQTTCSFCNEYALCYIYLEDNGYTTGALCLNCTMIIASEIANSENRPWRKSNGLYNPKEGGE